MNPTLTDDAFRIACEHVRRRLLAAGETRHDAEDIAQTATLEAYRGRATIRDPEALASFTWTIARRRAWRRWDDRMEAITDPHNVIIAYDPDPDDLEALTIDRHDVQSVLAMLPARERDLLWAHHVEGQPLDSLAARHGLAPSSMPRLLARARNSFRSAASGEQTPRAAALPTDDGRRHSRVA